MKTMTSKQLGDKVDARRYTVECFRNGSCKRSRKFKTVEQAVDFANDFNDDHADEGGWDVQIVTPAGAVHQTNINGNQSIDSIIDPTCKWFARCGRSATGTTPHPVLGAVPTCDRCAAFAAA